MIVIAAINQVFQMQQMFPKQGQLSRGRIFDFARGYLENQTEVNVMVVFIQRLVNTSLTKGDKVSPTSKAMRATVLFCNIFGCSYSTGVTERMCIMLKRSI